MSVSLSINVSKDIILATCNNFSSCKSISNCNNIANYNISNCNNISNIIKYTWAPQTVHNTPVMNI